MGPERSWVHLESKQEAVQAFRSLSTSSWLLPRAVSPLQEDAAETLPPPAMSPCRDLNVCVALWSRHLLPSTTGAAAGMFPPALLSLI